MGTGRHPTVLCYRQCTITAYGRRPVFDDDWNMKLTHNDVQTVSGVPQLDIESYG